MLKTWFALLGLLCINFSALAEPTYSSAVARLQGTGHRVVPVDDATRAQVQAYFAERFEDLRLISDGDAKPPIVVLIRPVSEGIQATVNAAQPGVIYWNAQFLLESPSGDIDNFVMAHELRHFDKDNRSISSQRMMEYDADGMALYERILRLNQRDPKTKQPQSAVINIDALVAWLRTQSEQRENYINSDAVITALKVTYAEHLNRRGFRQRPTPRRGLDAALATIAKTLETMPASNAITESTPSPASETIKRLHADVFAGLVELASLRSQIRADDESAPIARAFADTALLLTHQLNSTTDVQERVELLEKCGKLPVNLFGDFKPILNDVRKALEAMDAPVGLLIHELPDLDFVRRFKFRQTTSREADLRKALAKSSIDLNAGFAAPLATSRYLRALLESERPLNKHNELVTALFSIAMKNAAQQWIDPSGTASSPILDSAQALLQPFSQSSTAALSDLLMTLLLEQTEPRVLVANLTMLFGLVKNEPWFKEFRGHFLPLLPERGEYESLRFVMNTSDDSADYLDRLSARGPGEFTQLLVRIKQTDPRRFVDLDLENRWLDYLVKPIPKSDSPYFPELPNAVDQILDSTATNVYVVNQVRIFENHLARDSGLQRWADALTHRILQNPLSFIADFVTDQKNSPSKIFLIIDWDRVMESLDLEQIEHLIKTQYRHLLTRDHATYARFIRALYRRVHELAQDAEHDGLLSPKVLNVAKGLLQASSTITPEGQTLLALVMKTLTQKKDLGRLADTYFFLDQMKVSHFRNVDEFVSLYAEAMIEVESLETPVRDWPIEKLDAKVQSLYQKFDPLIASRIVEKLARAYAADLDIESIFAPRKAPALQLNRFEVVAFWGHLIHFLDHDQVVSLEQFLRGGRRLSPTLVAELQLYMIKLGVPVLYAHVADELRARFKGFPNELYPEIFGQAIEDSDHRAYFPRDVTNLRERLQERLATGRFDYMDILLGAKSTPKDREGKLLYQPPAASLERGIDNFHFWHEVLQGLGHDQVLSLADTLRAGSPLDAKLRLEVLKQLSAANILIPITEVERYLASRFRALSPLHRAGVLQLIMDGGSRLLDSPHYRKSIFRKVLERLPDAQTRATFLDIWDSALPAYPYVLRSLLVSILFSESSEVGSPERAMSLVFRQASALVKKFGQNLAFANLPEVYRAEMRTIWDGAQDLKWFEAWKLILVQKGDIRTAGYKLNRILNSGGTMAYLELKHVETGKTVVIWVHTDGIHHGVKEGSRQLRIFARELIKKDSRRYGFIALLVEDAIRTMKRELDPNIKREMTTLMGQAYRRAAQRLGFTVDERGIINVGEFKLTTIGEQTFTLPTGEVIEAQDVAHGVGLRHLKPIDKDRYLRLTRVLLRLEAEVLKDPTAPVDKDRMAGQNIFDEQTSVNYLLDAGQAMPLSPAVHAAFRAFTVHGFAGDVRWMTQTLTQLTGYAVKSPLAAQVIRAEAGLRPLEYLSLVAAPFLAMADGDPRKETYFELVHGVRAQLRLLQWEADDGLHDLADEIQRETRERVSSTALATAWLTSKVKSATEAVLKPMRGAGGLIQSPAERMEAAYILKPCAKYLDEEDETKAAQ